MESQKVQIWRNFLLWHQKKTGDAILTSMLQVHESLQLPRALSIAERMYIVMAIEAATKKLPRMHCNQTALKQQTKFLCHYSPFPDTWTNGICFVIITQKVPATNVSPYLGFNQPRMEISAQSVYLQIRSYLRMTEVSGLHQSIQNKTARLKTPPRARVVLRPRLSTDCNILLQITSRFSLIANFYFSAF